MALANRDTPADETLYTIVSPDFYEPLDRYKPDTDAFAAPVARLLPAGWSLTQQSIWCHCRPPATDLPAQGWKIHVSATAQNCAAILATVARVAARYVVPFKFAADRFVFYLLNTKRWPRSGAGKFITMYPSNQDQLRSLMTCLDAALSGYRGPYVLSDKRYGSNQVLYYRYGAFKKVEQLLPAGDRAHVIAAPDGSHVVDPRFAYFAPPEWAPDPFAAGETPAASNEPTLKNGRYTIESAISFSATGGIYRGIDHETQNTVLIKEARPLTGVLLNGYDAVALLKKEHRLLCVLEGLGIAPTAIDFFQDWEHWFLVEEFLTGRPLRAFATAHTVVLNTRPTPDDVAEFCAFVQRLYPKVATALAALHDRGIVFGDFSHNNIIILDGSEEPRFVDFEGAYEIGIDPPTAIFTPGFAHPESIRERSADVTEDLYALGALLMAALTPANALAALDGGTSGRFVSSIVSDFGLPQELKETIFDLMTHDRDRRPTATQVVERLREPWQIGTPSIRGDSAGERACRETVEDTIKFILATTTYDRDDRLFAADPAVFSTNPLNIAYGAAGVAYALNRTAGSIPAGVLEWLLARTSTTERLPPGLYVGSSGLAWVLLETGAPEAALGVAQRLATHPLLYRSADLFSGAAGWGMAMLRLFLGTGEEWPLARAREAAGWLIDTRREEEGKYFWPGNDDVYYGAAHGAAGIALFLLYLYLATRDEIFLDAGERALEFDISRAVHTPRGNGLTWQIREKAPTVTPYWRYGSAGIGMVALRYAAVSGRAKYRQLLDDILVDTDRKYTVFPGWFNGLAGIGDFLLDLERFGHRPDVARAAAQRVAAGILLFRIQREQGTAFPGDELLRLSCDFGTGSAGIVAFLHRYLTRTAAPFMLDELFEPAGVTARTGDADALYVA